MGAFKKAKECNKDDACTWDEKCIPAKKEKKEEKEEACNKITKEDLCTAQNRKQKCQWNEKGDNGQKCQDKKEEEEKEEACNKITKEDLCTAQNRKQKCQWNEK